MSPLCIQYIKITFNVVTLFYLMSGHIDIPVYFTRFARFSDVGHTLHAGTSTVQLGRKKVNCLPELIHNFDIYQAGKCYLVRAKR